MEIEISIEAFTIKLSIWKLWPPFIGSRAEYFGHTWAFSISWLWFELLVYGLPKQTHRVDLKKVIIRDSMDRLWR